MASILFVGSFLAGSLLSILMPVGLLIVIAVWHVRAITRIPRDPAETAAHGAGAAELEGRSDTDPAASETTPGSRQL
jgi:hypothetical protein